MKKIIVSIVILGFGIFLGVLFSDSIKQEIQITDISQNFENSTLKSEKIIAYWVAPMDANYRRDKPGKSPMGMDLVPVYEEDDELNGEEKNINAVKIEPYVMNNLGVRTAKVKTGGFQNRIEAFGYIDYNENKISHIHLRTEGWIEKIYVSTEGEKVKKGDALFEIYSPELVNAQLDYLNAVKSGRTSLIKASKERLHALDVPKHLIKQIKKQRKISQLVTVRAPQNGIVTEINVVEGMYVTPKTIAVSLVDLSSVWLIAEVFEKQANEIKEGLFGEIRFSNLPSKLVKGKISYIYPEIDHKTRSLKIRFELENSDEALKPGMYATVTVLGKKDENVITIPREGLIRTGTYDRVVLSLDSGRFQPAKVIVGRDTGDEIEILSGLKPDEEIVISSQFLIDSEASFKGTSLRMGAYDD